jgi:hypothetical protein
MLDLNVVLLVKRSPASMTASVVEVDLDRKIRHLEIIRIYGVN